MAVSGGIAKGLHRLYLVERAVASLSFGLMSVLMIIDITGREVFGHGLHWSQKVAVFLMIWGAFLGSTMTSHQGGHLRPEAATKLWPARFTGGITRASEALTAFAAAFFAYWAIVFVIETIELGDTGAVTDVPLWIVQIVIPYTFVSMALRHGAYALFPVIRPRPKSELDVVNQTQAPGEPGPTKAGE